MYNLNVVLEAKCVNNWNKKKLEPDGQCKTKTADCRLQTGGKMQTKSKMLTADCRPGVKCRLRVK